MKFWLLPGWAALSLLAPASAIAADLLPDGPGYVERRVYQGPAVVYQEPPVVYQEPPVVYGNPGVFAPRPPAAVPYPYGPGPRYAGPRYVEPPYGEPRYAEPRYRPYDPRYIPEPRYTEPGYGVPRDPGHAAPQPRAWNGPGYEPRYSPAYRPAPQGQWNDEYDVSRAPQQSCWVDRQGYQRCQ